MNTLYRSLSKYFTQITGISTDTATELNALEEAFKRNEVKSVLDVACGTGRHSIPLAKLGYNVTGIDISTQQIKNAKANAKKNKVLIKFLVKDANSFNFKRKFDAAICMWTTIGEEPLIYKKVIQNVFNSLKKNGIFIMDNTSWENIPVSRKKTRIDFFEKDGIKVKRTMNDIFTENFRIREGIFSIKNKTVRHLCITYLLKEKDWVNELKQAGFKKFEILHDYKPRRKRTPDKVMIIAKK